MRPSAVSPSSLNSLDSPTPEVGHHDCVLPLSHFTPPRLDQGSTSSNSRFAMHKSVVLPYEYHFGGVPNVPSTNVQHSSHTALPPSHSFDGYFASTSPQFYSHQSHRSSRQQSEQPIQNNQDFMNVNDRYDSTSEVHSDSQSTMRSSHDTIVGTDGSSSLDGMTDSPYRVDSSDWSDHRQKYLPYSGIQMSDNHSGKLYEGSANSENPTYSTAARQSMYGRPQSDEQDPGSNVMQTTDRSHQLLPAYGDDPLPEAALLGSPKHQSYRTPHKDSDGLMMWTWREDIDPKWYKPAEEALIHELEQNILKKTITTFSKHFCLEALKRNATPALLRNLFHGGPEQRKKAVAALLVVPGSQKPFQERRVELVQRLHSLRRRKSLRQTNTYIRSMGLKHFLLRDHLYSSDLDIMQDAFQRMWNERKDGKVARRMTRSKGVRLKTLFQGNTALQKKVLDKLKDAWNQKLATTRAHLRRKLFDHPTTAQLLLHDSTFPQAAAQLAPVNYKSIQTPAPRNDHLFTPSE